MRSLYLFAAGLMAIGSVSAVESTPMEKNPAVAASNAFACDLFKKLDEAKPGANLFFSPYSISSALAMTMEGARGQTSLEMGQVLRLPKDLRTANEKEPWATTQYCIGFGDFTRKITGGGDELKAMGIRKQVAELKTKLATVNAKIAQAERTGGFQQIGPLSQEANKLATSINALSKTVDQFDLRVANALFGEKTYPFKKAYLESVDKNFGSGHLREADFRNDYPGERAKINRWVEEQTNDRIKDLLPEIPPPAARLIRLILVNAIYFKGEWSQPFDEKQTKTEDFLLAAGGKASTKMMHLVNKDARYAAFNGDGTHFQTPTMISFDGGKDVATYPGADGFQIAEIPVKGDKLSMVVIAPRKADGLAAIEKNLTGENLTAWLGKLQKRSVNIAMPRFKLETDYALGDTLQSMGMKQAFQERIADFTGMSDSSDPDDRLYISKVLHKAFVEVNEKGAEAAAATAVIMATPTAIALSQPFTPEFRADRPFVFLIRDMDTGMVLFLGRMTQPQ